MLPFTLSVVIFDLDHFWNEAIRELAGQLAAEAQAALTAFNAGGERLAELTDFILDRTF